MAKLSNKDSTIARTLQVAPWVTLLATSLPGPIVFILLFLTATATDSAAIYLLLAGLSLAVGFALILALLVDHRLAVAAAGDRRDQCADRAARNQSARNHDFPWGGVAGLASGLP